MAEGNGTAPRNHSDGAKKKKSSKQQKQMKQLLLMTAMLVGCAVLITWTVMLMKDRLSQNAQLNEQSSAMDYMEVSGDESDSELTRQTAVPEFTETPTTSATTGTTGTGDTSSTTATNATAPKKVTVQSVQFSKIPTTVTKAQATTMAGGKTQTAAGKTQTTAKPQTKTNAVTTTAEKTTHTETQQVTPNTAPTEAQLPYNTLLALYLGAQAQGNQAYFFDAAGNSPATVVMHCEKAYRVATAADSLSQLSRLGGTGGTEEHPWQTGVAFRLYQYEDGDRYIYYTSAGDSYQIIGYYNCRTCDNVWARLRYYQVGAGWQAEYHIIHCNRPETQNGSESELFTSTFDAEALYTISTEFEQQLAKEMQGRGMSVGSWNNYEEVKADQQSDTLWNKAGSHNSGFAPQSGETYGVVTGSGMIPLYSAANTGSAAAASLPAGTFLSVPKDAIPAGTNLVPVQAKVNGTWVSGYIAPGNFAAWSEK